MTKTQILFYSIFVCLCNSCAQGQPEFSSKNVSTKVVLQQFSGGSKSQERELLKDSVEFKELLQWIDAHTNSWKPSIVSFAPKTIVRGDSFTLNFLRSKVVLNMWSTNLTNAKQFVLETPATMPRFVIVTNNAVR